MPCRCSGVLPAFAGLLAVFCWPSLAGASAADLGRETGAGPPSRGGGVPRASMDLSHGWRFRQEAGLAGVERSEFDDSQWTGVDLPHTWNRIGNEGAERSPLTNTVQGVGWYRLRFTAPSSSTARRYFLQFDRVGVIVETRIENESSVVVASESSKVTISPAQPVPVMRTLHVDRPHLWQGMKDPYLYKLLLTVRSTQGLDLDQVAQPLGLRSLNFDP